MYQQKIFQLISNLQNCPFWCPLSLCFLLACLFFVQDWWARKMHLLMSSRTWSTKQMVDYAFNLFFKILLLWGVLLPTQPACLSSVKHDGSVNNLYCILDILSCIKISDTWWWCAWTIQKQLALFLLPHQQYHKKKKENQKVYTVLYIIQNVTSNSWLWSQ